MTHDDLLDGWHDQFTFWHWLERGVLIVEDATSARVEAYPRWSLSGFLTADRAVRWRRVLERDGPRGGSVAALDGRRGRLPRRGGTAEPADRPVDGVARVGTLRKASTCGCVDIGGRRCRRRHRYDVKTLSGLWNERAWRLEYLGRAIRVDHRQHPRVHRLFAETAATLDLAELPELYVEFSPALNGGCIGMSRPFIVVTSRAVELYDDEELRYVLGHELGHLISGHAVYRTMMMILVNLANRLPFGPIALRVILFGLFEWWRKAELSADRAGLLAGQDPAAALRAHMKLAGGGDLREIDTAAFLDQDAEYDRGGDLRDSLIKLRMLIGLTHPLPMARAADLRRWVDDGSYGRILAGDYPRRAQDRDASMSDAAREARRVPAQLRAVAGPAGRAAPPVGRRRGGDGGVGRRRCQPGTRLVGRSGCRTAARRPERIYRRRAGRVVIRRRVANAEAPRRVQGSIGDL